MSRSKYPPSLVRHVRAEEDRLSDVVTRFCGSFTFVILHALWFTAWIGFNELLPKKAFDPFPFGLLTMIVSLEAIFLSTFVLISQNRDAQTANNRALADFRTNVYAEVLSQLTAQRVGVDLDLVETIVEQQLRDTDVDGTPAGEYMLEQPGDSPLKGAALENVSGGPSGSDSHRTGPPDPCAPRSSSLPSDYHSGEP